MDRKGVSGLLVAIFLTIISVALAGAFLLFGTATQETFEKEVGGGVEKSVEQLQGGLAIFEVKENRVTVKNTGRTNVDASKIGVLLDGQRAAATTTATTLAPGETAQFTVSDFVPGVHTVRLLGPAGAADEGEFAVVLPGTVSFWDFEDEDAKPDDVVGDNDGNLNGSTVVLLHFDEGSGDKAADTTNYKNNATLKNGATWTAGVNGNGLFLDGTNDYADLPDLATLNTFTVEAWYFVRGNSQFPDALVLSDDVDNYVQGDVSLDVRRDDLLQFTVQNGTDGVGAINTGAISTKNAWHYIVGTYDGKTAILYLDGKEVGRKTVTGATPFSNARLVKIGRLIEPNTHHFNGNIDEVAVHSRALSATEIQERFASKRAQFSEYVEGVKGTALLFKGSNSDVIVPDSSSLDLTGSLSVEAWVRTNQLNPSANKVIVWKGNTIGSDATSPYSLALHQNNTFFFMIGDNTNAVILHTTNTISANQWYHVVGTADGSTMRIYVNGVEKGSRSQTVTPYNSAHRLIFGGLEGASGNYFNGAVDYVALYNRALSATEVRSIYDSAVS